MVKKTKLPIDLEGIIHANPETVYTFDDNEIGTGKYSVVKKVTCKKTGKAFAAKIIKFDDVSVKYAIREYELMKKSLPKAAEEWDIVRETTPKLHEAYLVRKYLILIMDLCDGKTLLEFFADKQTISEEDVSTVLRKLCQLLHALHSQNIVHLDIRPTNIRMTSLNDLKLLDYNSARHLANKKAGEVVDVIGDTEFCAPEMLSFDRVSPQSDMWSVAVIMYILLSGTSPFYYADESRVSYTVEKCKYEIDDDIIRADAKDFFKKMFKRGPEMRMTAETALQHNFLNDKDTSKVTIRKSNKVSQGSMQDTLKATDKRLLSEEEDEYVEASLIFKTFDEEEHVSTEEEDSDDEQQPV